MVDPTPKEGQYTDFPKEVTNDTSGWKKFTTPRPFTKCADCGRTLAPSAPQVCVECLLQREHSMPSKAAYLPGDCPDELTS